jgi:hypothetical protein
MSLSRSKTRSKRITRSPKRYTDEKFLPCANNKYTAGRRIDPGFYINGDSAPFDDIANMYHMRYNEDRRNIVPYNDEKVDENLTELYKKGEEEWVPSETEESEEERIDKILNEDESEDEWIPSENEIEGESDDEWIPSEGEDEESENEWVPSESEGSDED